MRQLLGARGGEERERRAAAPILPSCTDSQELTSVLSFHDLDFIDVCLKRGYKHLSKFLGLEAAGRCSLQIRETLRVRAVGLGRSSPWSALQPEPPCAHPRVSANHSFHDLRGRESQQHYPSQRPEEGVLSALTF